MKRIILISTYLILTTGLFSQTVITEETECKRKQIQAAKEVQNNIIKYTLNFGLGGWLPRYQHEIRDVLAPYGIEFEINPVSDVFPNGQHCYKNFMDSVITAKFGDSFIKMINERADSLFYERHKNSIFSYWDVDEWARHPSNQQQLGGDYIIEYLNKSIEQKGSYRFVSNIVNKPYVRIELIIDKLGNTSSCMISKRELNGLNGINLNALENFITQTIEQIDDWTPAKIKGNNVTAKFQRSVAIEI